MNSFLVSTIKDNSFFNHDLLIDKNFLLLNSLCPFTDSLKKTILEWGFKTVYSEGSQGVEQISAPVKTAPEDFKNVSIDDL